MQGRNDLFWQFLTNSYISITSIAKRKNMCHLCFHIYDGKPWRFLWRFQHELISVDKHEEMKQ
jgi:hypothetical protein